MGSPNLNAVVDFCSGALGAACADVSLFPLDTVRARVMVMAGTQRPGLLREGLSLVKLEGFAALYKGLGVHLLASIPANGIFYTTYEATRAALVPLIQAPALCSALGGVAGCLASLAIYSPMEVVKQRAMVTQGASSVSALRALLKSEGPLGLYRGIGAGALTWAPYFGFYFWVYEALLSNLCGIAAGENPSFGVALGCGLAAGCSASALTNPFDVVKTRLMVGSTGIGARAAGGSGGANSARTVVRQILATEGPSGFGRGMVPRMLLLAPVSSLTIAFYSLIHGLLDGVASQVEQPPQRGAERSKR